MDSYNWAQIDYAAVPQTFLEYLDTYTALEAVQAYKQQSYELLHLQSGHHVLDAGSGSGSDVRALASMVGPTGRVVGVDNSQTMIRAAQRRAAQYAQAAYCPGSVYRLQFANNLFDSARADNLLTYLLRPQRALAEMVRVVRPGGRVVVSEPDWETLLLDMPNQVLTRKVVDFRRKSLLQGRAGRQLPRRLRQAGLVERAIVPVTLVVTDYATANRLFQLKETACYMESMGLLSRREVHTWLEKAQTLDHNGRFFSSVTLFTVGGRKL